MLYFLLSTLVLTLYIDVVLSLSIELKCDTVIGLQNVSSSDMKNMSDSSNIKGVDLGVDQYSSESDMEVDHRSRGSRTMRTELGPRSCEFAGCPGYSIRYVRHFAGNHLPWFVIPQTACWECGRNRVQVKQLQKHLLHEHNLRIDNLDAYTHRSIPFFVTQIETILMSIATDLNLSYLQDLVDYLQWQDMRPSNYTLSLHFHNAVTEFCDRNHLPQSETMELHPPTHVSGLLHHSSVVSLLSQLPSYRQKEYLYFLVGNVDDAVPTQKKVRYADLAAIGHASRKSSTSSVSSASSRPRSASRPCNQLTLSGQRSVKLVQSDHGLWPDDASMDNFSCSSHDYVTDAHFHPCMIVEQAHLKQPLTWSRIAAKAKVAPDFRHVLVKSAVACYLAENRDTPFHFMQERSVHSTNGIHPKHALEYNDAQQNVETSPFDNQSG